MKMIDDIYIKSPVILQNIFVSLMGLKLEWVRRNKKYIEQKHLIRERDRWSDSKFRDYQDMQLRYIINYAYENVPFYKQYYDELGIDVKKVNGVNSLPILPVIEKSMIKNMPGGFVDKTFKQKSCEKVKTTGTTGTPLEIISDALARQINYAFFDAFLESIGVNPFGKKATFGGRIVVSSYQKLPPFWRHSIFQKNVLFSSYHMSDKNMPAYINKLKEYVPEMIEAYPSSIYRIACYMKEHDLRGIHPKAIITSAETLFKEQRDIIEQVFGCKVYDQYGAAEMCVFAYQCRSGNYHIRPDYGVFEILKDGKAAPFGELGEIVCTGFINRRMPLIRYKIGDVGTLSSKKCNCGLKTPLLESLDGRIDDIVYTKSGTPIGRLSPVLKGYPVKEAIYIQEVIGKIAVHIVKDYGFEQNHIKDVEKELRKRVGGDMDIEIILVDKIERNGIKNKSVVSNIKNKTNFK